MLTTTFITVVKNLIKTVVLFSLTVAAVAVLLIVNILILNAGNLKTLNLSEYTNLLILITLIVVISAITAVLFSKFIVRIFLCARTLSTAESTNELRFMSTVKRLSDAVGITMPEIVIYQGHDINAFATGFRRNSAMLAVSQQLLDVMTQDEMEGVVGHEISHIANGDMLTLALMQGIVNCLVYLPANSLQYVFGKFFKPQQFYNVVFYYLVVTLTQLSIAWMASLLVMWFSRQREFHADRCGAKIAGNESMLRALECLQACKETTESSNLVIRYDTIFRHSIYQLFISHPSLSARITALRNLS